MTALSDALAATQARAVAALAKRYVGGTLGEDETPETILAAVGLNDPTDTAHLIAAWDFLRESGAEPPSEAKPAANRNGDEPASEAQVKLIAKLCDERTIPHPIGELTKVQAHEIIDAIKAGTYQPEPF